MKFALVQRHEVFALAGRAWQVVEARSDALVVRRVPGLLFLLSFALTTSGELSSAIFRTICGLGMERCKGIATRRTNPVVHTTIAVTMALPTPGMKLLHICL
jgi:hypothetical protein